MGVDPRPSVADYPSHAGNEAVSVGAVLVGGADQKKMLGKDFSGSYVIVEAALYPEPGHTLTVAPRDFLLRAGTESVAPVDAEDMEPLPNPKHGGPVPVPGNVHTETIEAVGVATGPNGRKVVYTGTEVGVGIGNYPDPRVGGGTAPSPRFETRRALEQKELPDIKTAKPAAGFLYFPKPRNADKKALYQLDYYGQAGKIRLTLQPAKKRGS
jgi:hypothetical protein